MQLWRIYAIGFTTFMLVLALIFAFMYNSLAIVQRNKIDKLHALRDVSGPDSIEPINALLDKEQHSERTNLIGSVYSIMFAVGWFLLTLCLIFCHKVIPGMVSLFNNHNNKKE